jgi:hypothetical protein
MVEFTRGLDLVGDRCAIAPSIPNTGGPSIEISGLPDASCDWRDGHRDSLQDFGGSARFTAPAPGGEPLSTRIL